MASKFKAENFIDAIPGSGGIISTIAKRVGCDWHTVKKAIDDYPTVKAAYDNEVEFTIDISESLVLDNIKLAKIDQQNHQKPVDTSDAKWYLSKKGKGRGYGDKLDVDLKKFDLSQLSTEQLDRIAKGEDVYSVIANPGSG